MNTHAKSFFSRLRFLVNPFSFTAPKTLYKRTRPKFAFSSAKFGYSTKYFRKRVHSSVTFSKKKKTPFYPQERKSFLEEFSTMTNENNVGFFSVNRLFRPIINSTKSTVNPYLKRNKLFQRKGKKFVFMSQSKAYQKALYSLRAGFCELAEQRLDTSETLDPLEAKTFELALAKLRQFQKLYLSLRLRKSHIPQVVRFRKNRGSTSASKNEGFRFYRRSFKRKGLLRFYSKRRKKITRQQKIPRLKSVHFFIPTYLQVDFRTLRSVKIQSPSLEDIHYPFRISLAKRYAFYRSKGF